MRDQELSTTEVEPQQQSPGSKIQLMKPPNFSQEVAAFRMGVVERAQLLFKSSQTSEERKSIEERAKQVREQLLQELGLSEEMPDRVRDIDNVVSTLAKRASRAGHS